MAFKVIVDTEYLEQLIKDRGIKKTFIADKMGIAIMTFYNKMNNISEFTFGEAQILFDILSASVQEQKKIFVKK